MDGSGSSSTHGVISFGPFRLLAAERQLKKGAEPLHLGARALDTLIVLVERAGEVVTQRELISRVWPDVTVEEANLRVHIANLRKALGDGRGGARYIATVPGRGYCFVAPVTPFAPHPSLPLPDDLADRLQVLPPKLTRMIGRDDTIRSLSAQLMMCRFVSIVGPGGIGKTTVAISVAHALSDGFNGGVFFVDLAALTDAKLVPTAVASTLGFMIQAQDPLLSLLAFIGDRKILLVLDNCEHVIDVVAMLAERVVSGSPQAHVLTTSREALRVEGEHVHLLYALCCPPEVGGLTAAGALAYPAVQLFMERAAAGGYDAALGETDAPIVAAICRRLDGIALAIELAASRAGSLGVRGVAELLDNRFNLIWRGRRTALPRHQTLNAMLDWSYNLLLQHERAVLNRLSVFVGNFNIEAARFVAAEAETDELSVNEAIASLVAKSLIATTALGGLTYYRLLETTRNFAQAKLVERGEASRIARRHANFFSEFLQQDQIVQSRFGEHDLSAYTSHIGNVRAALEWAFSDSGDAGAELVTRALPLFIGSALLEECTRWCERALADLDADARGTRQEMILQEALALCLMYTSGNTDRVRAAIERALPLEEAFGDHRHRLELLYGLYRLFMRLADFRGALAVAQQSATFAQVTEDPAGLLLADFMLGTYHHYIGNQAEAQLYVERCMSRAAEPGTLIPNFFGFDYRVYTPISLGRALWLRGFSDQARRIAKSAIDETASGVRPLSTCVSLAYGTPIFLWSGDFKSADDYIERLIEYAGRHSLEPYRAAGLGLKGTLAIARDKPDIGVDLLRHALEILTVKKLHLWLGEFTGALAEGLRKTGQVEEALIAIDRAIARATDCGTTFWMAELLRIKAQVLAGMPQHGRIAAISCLTEALAVARAQSALALELRLTMASANLLTEEERRDQGHRDIARIYDRFSEGFETADLRMARQIMEDLA
jgi:predicted ATPase/DNA-binding winged helix-turn-helix (wHTH) protein